jgi:hypothetical protein
MPDATPNRAAVRKTTSTGDPPADPDTWLGLFFSGNYQVTTAMNATAPDGRFRTPLSTPF